MPALLQISTSVAPREADTACETDGAIAANRIAKHAIQEAKWRVIRVSCMTLLYQAATMRSSPPFHSPMSVKSQLQNRLASLAMMAALAGCATPERTDYASYSLPQTLQALAHRHHVCGAALAVIKARKVVAVETASGCIPPAGLSADTVFQAASLSKPVFAYGVLQLVAQGKMALDAPVTGYLPPGYRHRYRPLRAEPSAPVTDPRLQAVTVRMALNHTTGLPNWSSGPLAFGAAPGARWDYSGEGYVLLQRAVEAVTGMPLDQFMRMQVFAPLSMDRSDYIVSPRIASHLLSGTKANGAPRAGLALKTPVAAFSLHSSAADLGKFLSHVLNDESMLRQITAAPVTVDPGLKLSWGLGWGIEHGNLGDYLWQWGNNPGYRAFAMASVRTGDGFVMLTNSENGLQLAEPLARKILPDEHRLFQSPVLGTDVISIACNTLRICL